MQGISRWAIAAAALALLAPAPAFAQRAEDEIERLEESMAVLRDLTRTSSNQSIPADVLARAEAVIVIPDMVRGGLIVGVLENLCGAYLVGTELKLTVALVIIIGVLLVKPAGLFGRSVVTRV